jgi:hypothetical protein
MAVGTTIAVPNGLGWVDSQYAPLFLAIGAWLVLGGTFDAAAVLFGWRGRGQGSLLPRPSNSRRGGSDE